MVISRRELLARASAIPGVAMFSNAPRSLFPDSPRIGSAHAPSPDYLEGRVVRTAPGICFVEDRWFKRPEPVALRIVPGTVICKGLCEWQPEAIKVGDRIEGATKTLPDGTRTASWVMLNVVAFTGRVLAVHPDHLVVQRRKHTCTNRVHVPHTAKIRDGGPEFPGSTSRFAIGDSIQVAGAAINPNDDAVVIATSLIKVFPVKEA